MRTTLKIEHWICDCPEGWINHVGVYKCDDCGKKNVFFDNYLYQKDHHIWEKIRKYELKPLPYSESGVKYILEVAHDPTNTDDL